MSEDRTPVEVAADAIGQVWLAAAENRVEGEPMVVNGDDVARAAFGSVDVDGLAAEIGRHWLLEPSHTYGGAERVTRSCVCGRELAPQYFEWRHSQEMTQHEAEAVKAWLTGGGA